MSSRIKALICVTAMTAALWDTAASAREWEVKDSVLVIERTATRIGARQFADRTDIVRVEFESPSAMREIGEYAFLGCVNLRQIEFPHRLRKIGEGALRECESLREVSIPAGVKALPKYLFAWCDRLERVALPSGLTDIGSHAFAYCRSLKDIEIPGKVAHIGSNAFAFCSTLREVVVPTSVTELESYAFAECAELRDCTLPANPRMLGELIFSGCRNMEKITELSAEPPTFDCDSTPFEANEQQMYEKCVLTVPAGAEARYRTASGWRNFKEIRNTGKEATGQQ